MTYIEELWDLTGGRTLLLPSAGLIALDDRGRILLQKRNDDGTWGIPGGFLEIGESLEQAIRREACEELDLELGRLRLFEVFAGPDHYHDYPDRGRVYSVSAVYIAERVGGEMRLDPGEVGEVRFFEPSELPAELEQNTRIILAAYAQQELGRG